MQVRDNGSPSLSGYTYITVILDVARNTPATPIQLPHQSQQQNQNEKQPVSRLPYQKPPGGIVARDNVQPLTDPRRSGTSTDQHWPEEEESFFGSEHTLILIICLSAIATMLVFILFMMLAWLRRRGGASNHRHRSRLDVTGPGGLGCGVAGGGGATKRVFLEGSGGGTLLAPPTHVWAEEPVAKEETSGGLNKRMSPVYWLKTPTTVNNVCLVKASSPVDTYNSSNRRQFSLFRFICKQSTVWVTSGLGAAVPSSPTSRCHRRCSVRLLSRPTTVFMQLRRVGSSSTTPEVAPTPR